MSRGVSLLDRLRKFFAAPPPPEHTGRTVHPTTSAWLELVAYERVEGGWDAFLFEPKGLVPDAWEEFRTDPEHVFVGRLEKSEELDGVAEKLRKSLPADLEPVRAFREETPGENRRCKRALHLLHKHGCTGYAMKRATDGHFEFWARKRDLKLIAQLSGSSPTP